MRGCLPEVVLVVLEALGQCAQDSAPKLLHRLVFWLDVLQTCHSIVKKICGVARDDRLEAVEEHDHETVYALATQCSAILVVLGQLIGPIEQVAEYGSERGIVELVDHLDGDAVDFAFYS